MSFLEIDTSSVKPSHFKEVHDLINGAASACCTVKKASTIKIDAKRVFSTSGDQANFLGDITLRLQGEMRLDGNGKWSFKGTLRAYDDWYDFNASTHRKIIGEILTMIGRNTPGKPFWIEIRGEKPISEEGKVECKK
jgi:hypothetical protein